MEMKGQDKEREQRIKYVRKMIVESFETYHYHCHNLKTHPNSFVSKSFFPQTLKWHNVTVRIVILTALSITDYTFLLNDKGIENEVSGLVSTCEDECRVQLRVPLSCPGFVRRLRQCNS